MIPLKIRLLVALAFVRAAKDAYDYARACDIEACAHYGERGWQMVTRQRADGTKYRRAVRS